MPMVAGASFEADIQEGYHFRGKSIVLGLAKKGDTLFPDCPVRIPLRTLNRHGLIAGATGTGKTKTLQVLAEGLSENGIPVLLMDIKGDLSGLAANGDAGNPVIRSRYKDMGLDYIPRPFPVELLSLSDEPGAKLRATITEFGPLLLAKILDLNDTQEGLLAVLFKYCDDKALPLLDFKDLIQLLRYAGEAGKDAIEKDYGRISSASLSTILRKAIALQQQGADMLFGEPSFNIEDLLHTSPEGEGILHILRVTDMQDRPAVFSTFMLQLLAELYASLPEAGDPEKPKLVLFIDEAHLLFKEGGQALLQQLETVIKLIRSKGVGIFFCTQTPTDIPSQILGQLGMKIQHALRAFTANDRKAIKKTAENYPLSANYDADKLITEMGTGEAMVTLLNEKGMPTPLVHTFLLSPRSRMDILKPEELEALQQASRLIPKYNQSLDRESAYELLQKKLPEAAVPEPEKATGKGKAEKSWLDKALNSPAGKQLQRSFVRTLFGIIGKAFK